jgi:hypothetical protein
MQYDLIDGKAEVEPERLTSVSAVILAASGALDACALHQFLNTLSRYCIDVETVIVSNGAEDQGLLALKRLVADVPDCSCFVIADPIDPDAARVFGMETAVGDYVLLVNAEVLTQVVAALPMTMRSLQDGYDLVVALPKELDHRARLLDLLEGPVYGLLSSLAGFAVSRVRSDLLAFSRDAALHTLSKPNVELMLKAHTAGPGFPAHAIPDAYVRSAATPDRRSFAHRAAKAVGLLISIGAAPARLVSVVSLISSLLSLLYACYVVVIYLFKPNVVSGWTTLSLQVSGAMFLVSVMLALLSEYIIQIHAATAVRRRRQMVRELRSEKTARANRLNVIDESGVYRFGAPQSPPKVGKQS